MSSGAGDVPAAEQPTLGAPAAEASVALSLADGIATFRANSWSGFLQFLDQEVFNDSGRSRHRHIWRGQREANWSLSTSLDRLFGSMGWLAESAEQLEGRSKQHLDAFIYAARGRRGASPPKMEGHHDWWALGQHFGLATPLLDWSWSPFAAAYFAFEDPTCANGTRAVFALDVDAVAAVNFRIQNGPPLERGRIPLLEVFDPVSDENPRLVSQGGLFTRSPIGTPVEHWVAQAFAGDTSTRALLKVEIPTGERIPILRGLDRMNINHLSLFPDLSGASRFTNLRTELGLTR